ncbi:D111/G-patch domain-containing protein [Zea mays]|uniref:D111/G-patch domain-containing protein n=1 Tax=Zea mays TaxID=4577 RepID=A0A1D6P2V4_MAIZE|nr:D111/G-patch domain-containing protein [Zea mays]
MAELQDDHRPEGYDPDSRAGAGAEPVGIEIRRSRAGLGAEEPVLAPTPVLAPVEKPREVSERERRQQEEMAAELRARKSTQWKGRRVVWDYRKAERALAQLENREVEPQAPEGEEKEKGAEEEDDVITEEDLQNILSKLRDQYQYCLYCGCKYESPEVLANECSGPDNTVMFHLSSISCTYVQDGAIDRTISHDTSPLTIYATSSIRFSYCERCTYWLTTMTDPILFERGGLPAPGWILGFGGSTVSLFAQMEIMMSCLEIHNALLSIDYGAVISSNRSTVCRVQ